MEIGRQDLCNTAQSRGARWASFRKSGSVGTSGIDISSQIWSPLRDHPLKQFLQTASSPEMTKFLQSNHCTVLWDYWFENRLVGVNMSAVNDGLLPLSPLTVVIASLTRVQYLEYLNRQSTTLLWLIVTHRHTHLHFFWHAVMLQYEHCCTFKVISRATLKTFGGDADEPHLFQLQRWDCH